MKESFRQSMSWLHTWSGLVCGWLLFMMFLVGTAAVFNDEITAWMSPEIGLPPADPIQAVAAAQARLGTVAPDARSWTITLPSDRFPAARISWQPAPREAGGANPPTEREVLDASGRAVTPRETRGGDLFHRLHYRFEFSQPVQRAWWISGAATMFMLVAMVTGIVVHRRFFRDFFTFRPIANRQRSWLDAHLLLGVLLLPFHFMIAYTGLVPIMSTVMPWPIVASYGNEEGTALERLTDVGTARSAYSSDRQRSTPRPAAAGIAAEVVPLTRLAEEARAVMDAELGSITVRNPNDRNATVEIVRRPGGELTYRPQRVAFDGVSGARLPSDDGRSAVQQLQSAMYGMHMARFAEPALRWTYFAAGLASTAMIGAGLIVWVTKRRKRYAERVPFGQRLVESLNAASLAGLPIAMACYFWANRLLPLEIEERAAAEVRVFFLVWLLTLIYAALRPPRRAWIELLAVAAVAFGALPVLNAVTTGRHLFASLAAGDWLFFGFDATMAAAGLLFAFAGWKYAHVTAPQRVAAPVVAPSVAAPPIR